MTFSTRPGLAAPGLVVACLVGASLLVSCNGSSGNPDGGGTSTAGTSDTASPSPTRPPESLTHDGRTIRPVLPDDCSTPSTEKIRSVLGPLAEQVQPPVAKSSTKDGLTELNCAYSLVPVAAGQVADPGNAVIISTTTAADKATLDSLGLPRLMMSPTPVGTSGSTWFSVNKLSATTEYVLESVEGLSVVRVQLGLPASAPEVSQPQDKLWELAGT